MSKLLRFERTGPDRGRLSVFREAKTGTRRISEVTGPLQSLRAIGAAALMAITREMKEIDASGGADRPGAR